MKLFKHEFYVYNYNFGFNIRVFNIVKYAMINIKRFLVIHFSDFFIGYPKPL